MSFIDRIIDEVAEKEDDVERCGNCRKLVEGDEHCPRCGVKTSLTTSSPEDGL